MCFRREQMPQATDCWSHKHQPRLEDLQHSKVSWHTWCPYCWEEPHHQQEWLAAEDKFYLLYTSLNGGSVEAQEAMSWYELAVTLYSYVQEYLRRHFISFN